MPKKPSRFPSSQITLLERSRLEVTEYLSRRFRLLFKAFNENEIEQVEKGIENALSKAFKDAEKFEEGDGENRKSHEYASRSSGVEAQSLHVFGPASRYNRPPVFSKRG